MDQPTRRLEPPDDADAEDADDADSGATQRLGPPQRRRATRRPLAPRPSGPTCPKCQGAMLDVRVNIPSGRITLKRPDVLVGWLGGATGLAAQTCKSCGYVEFYAANLDDLLRE